MLPSARSFCVDGAPRPTPEMDRAVGRTAPMRRALLDGEGRLRVGWRLLIYVLVFTLCGAAASAVGHALRNMLPRWLRGLEVLVVGGGACVLGFRMLRLRMDWRPWNWLGLTFSWGTVRALLWGFSTGVFMLVVVFGVEWRLGWIEPTWVAARGRLSAVLGALLAALAIGLLEELLLRARFSRTLANGSHSGPRRSAPAWSSGCSIWPIRRSTSMSLSSRRRRSRR